MRIGEVKLSHTPRGLAISIARHCKRLSTTDRVRLLSSVCLMMTSVLIAILLPLLLAIMQRATIRTTVWG